MRNQILVSVILTAIGLNSCKMVDSSLTLGVPKSEMILQQIPSNQKGRTKCALYLPAREISATEFNTPALYTLIDSMYAIMLRKSGIGISANQLGKRLQIFIIEAKADNPRYKVLGPVPKQIFINPIITKFSSTKRNFWHGCLSAVGKDRGNVATYEWLEFQCKNEKGETTTGRLDGFAAVIFQHEFRHLMKGTYLDVAKQFLPKTELDAKVGKGEIEYFGMASDSLPLLIQGYNLGETLDAYHAN
jgi:peptide deformylase